MLTNLFPHVEWDAILDATYETLYMSAVTILATFILGLILGLVLFLTGKGNMWQNRFFNGIIAAVINVFRSIPFIILIILLLPFTNAIVGDIIGADAALPALIIGAAPFYARMVEIGLREVDRGVIEAARSMGAGAGQIIFKVLIPESLPALISGITVTGIAIIGYTAMAGIVGAGGLGNMAYLQGFQRDQTDVTFVATVIILVIVFVIQIIGDTVTRRLDKR
ncbi:ABC transporter [Fictibacillus macauensis ZFHKF-1]|uniref:ABC transporter n=1 Tax=Fictibacillus macauensis ZFHKF-1 TaxID=1196324 RepID=I8UJZ8_9BACL|nr:methionine ABC transporter permease [Fictibacillus macauensis]EIT87153.1 ABC transporter [Fictibacillus macauensis ZFHKF-1]